MIFERNWIITFEELFIIWITRAKKKNKIFRKMNA